MKLFCLMVGLFASQFSAAEMYGGIGITNSSYDASTSFTINGVGIVGSADYSQLNPHVKLGYRVNNNFSFEGQYLKFGGDADLSVTSGGNSTTSNFDVDGQSLGIYGIYHMDNFYAKIGLHGWDIDFAGAPLESNTDLAYGIGYDIKGDGEASNLVVRLEYETMKLGGVLDDTMSNFSASLIWGF